jgi:hypothetical protein
VPPETVQRHSGPLVTRNVSIELSSPEMPVGLWHFAPRAAVPMPKAPVDDNRQPVPRDNKIGTAGEVFAMLLKANAAPF